MPKVTIDGVEVTVEPGTNLIEAAYKAGKVVPHFCYHPKLSVAGNCRMCLVEIEGARKPEVACNTAVREGMVVYTDSERVKKLRRGVLELLFLNHPLDCPICDKSGECKLQDYYLEHGQYASRLDEGKVRKPKRLDIGEQIILDTERCVLCTRCVRFCDQITKTGELRIMERGSHSQIGIHPARRLDNPYSICVTDICPVGALTSKEFRFKARVWYLERTPTICGGCATGCNIEAHHRKGEVQRFMPRRNDAVNETWMCDDGRLGHLATQKEKRQIVCQQCGSGHTRWDEALEKIKRKTSDIREQHGKDSIGFVLSPEATLEENYLVIRIASQLEAGLFLVAGNPVGAPRDDEDEFLVRADKTPNALGARLLAEHGGAQKPAALMKALEKRSIKALFVLHNDVVGKAQEAEKPIDAFKKLELLVAIDTHSNTTTRMAHFALPLATYLETDGTWASGTGRVQRLRRAVNPPEEVRAGWELLPMLAAALGVDLETRSPQSVFAEMGNEMGTLGGMTYEMVGELGAPLSTEPQED